jgi:hypothetical protein
MTKVTAQMAISLDGCYAGPMDPHEPQDAAGWMQGPEAPGFFRVARWCASCRTWVGDDPNAATNFGFRTTYEN